MPPDNPKKIEAPKEGLMTKGQVEIIR